jgi:hypothetical protein
MLSLPRPPSRARRGGAAGDEAGTSPASARIPLTIALRNRCAGNLALGDIARAQGMTRVARMAGLGRETARRQLLGTWERSPPHLCSSSGTSRSRDDRRQALDDLIDAEVGGVDEGVAGVASQG